MHDPLPTTHQLLLAVTTAVEKMAGNAVDHREALDLLTQAVEILDGRLRTAESRIYALAQENTELRERISSVAAFRHVHGPGA
jgi:hypothetical protein